MPDSGDQLSSAKVLIFVALFTWSATTVVSAGSMLPDGTRTSYASDAMDTSHALVSRQQFLGSTSVATTARHRADEERISPDLSGILHETALGDLIKNFRSKNDNTLIARLSARFSPSTKDKFVENPFFLDWVNFVISTRRQFPNGEKEALKVILILLAEHLEEKLVTNLVAATKVEESKDIAVKMTRILAHLWAKDKRTPEEVFTALEIHEPNVNPFDNPLMAVWEEYVQRLEPDTASQTMFEVLKQKYAKDELVRFLVAGAKNEGTGGAVAASVLDAQIKIWEEDPSLDVIKVYHLLGLDSIQDKLGQSILFDKWYKHFVKRLLQWIPLEERYKTMLLFVESHCTEKNLVSVYAYGTRQEETKDVVKIMLDARVNKWVGNPNMDTEKVYNLLGIRETEGKAEQRPLISCLYSFAKARYPTTYSEKIRAIDPRLVEGENRPHKRMKQEGPKLKDD